MDTVKSFKGYGKVDEREDAEFRQKTRKRLIILSISAVLLVGLIVGVVAGTIAHNKNKNANSDEAPSTSAAIKSICSVTQYTESCKTSLSSSKSTDPQKIFQFSLSVAMDSLEKIANFPAEYSNNNDLDEKKKQALQVCSAVLSDAVESLNDTIAAASVSDGKQLVSAANDLRTWLSTVITDQETCFDALYEAETNATIIDEIRSLSKSSTEFVSNSLAIATKVLGLLGDFKIPAHRRLLGEVEAGFPTWVGAAERRLLQESRPKPDLTVAKDGSGDVTTLNEAVKKIKKKNKTRFVIYVKAGEYVENVLLEKAHWNVMIYGDGAAATVVSGSKNFVDGTPTFETATFAPKKPNWRSGEDRYLCGIYLDICQDPIVANNQKRDAFWQRIVAKYNDELRPSHIIERNFRSIQCRMSTILTECRKFDGCIKQVERLHPSGANQQIILQNANEFFVQDKGSTFKFDHVFEMVKDILQLETTRSVSSLPQENADSVNPSLSSFEINLSSDENFSTGGSSSQRPEGVKKSKAKRKQSEDVSILAKSFNESTEKLRETLSLSHAQREFALQLEKEKQQLEKEKQQLERERLEVMKKGQEMKQLKREDKILAMDTDAISDPERRNYFRNLQQQILRKRTEEEQSTSTTFNVFGMNFDNLGGSGGGLSGY